ncbi:sensor histidine kinase [Clostridium manihotivorum]|nr:HAMP domain-containing sensor histidine kinase [Clostridium manihotivorum]
MLLLNTLITSLLEKSYIEKIKKDCDSLYKTSRSQIYEYENIKNFSLDETNLEYQARSLVNVINTPNQQYIRILDKNLQEIFSIDKGLEKIYITKSSDLESAKLNKAYTTISNINNKYIASFSYPLYFNNKFVGIINFKNDYTYLYNEKNMIIYNLNIILLLTLIIVTVITTYMTNKIINPLYKLMEITDRISKGSYASTINIRSNDELGTLAAKFNIMQDTIKENMETIKELESFRRQFFNNVTHELKTPLTGIKLYAQLLEEEYNNPQFVANAAERIKSESDRLYIMVEDLLNISKGTTAERNEILNVLSIKPIVETIISDMTLQAINKGMDLIITLEDASIKAYKNHIIQLFINLLDNAIKYGKENSSIYIDIFNKDNFCNISIKNSVENNSNTSIASNGIGLFIVDSIISRINGSYTIQNNDGIFSIKIKIPSL